MDLSYASTVPKHLVHRQSVSEVFLTDYRLGTNSADLVAVQFPASHRTLGPTRQRHDPLIVAEAFRQAFIMLSHEKYGVPQQHRFLMEHFGFDIVEEPTIDPPSSQFVFHISGDGEQRSDNSAHHRISLHGELREGGQVIAHCDAIARCVSPASYASRRGDRESFVAENRPTTPHSVLVSPGRIGRRDWEDVLIADEPRVGKLYCVPDPHNRALFDHPLDHIPGMVLFDTAEQAVRYRTRDPSLRFTRLTADFPRFTEWDAPCLVDVSVLSGSGGRNRSCVKFVQSDRITAQVDITPAAPI